MQQELFSELSRKPESRPSRFHFPLFPGRFLTVKVAYEDLVCGLLSLVLLLLGGFCLGVERGKQLGASGVSVVLPLITQETQDASETGSGAPAGSLETGLTQEALTVPVGVPKPAVPAARGPILANAGQLYVIQLASYVGARSARSEAERLRRRGVQTRVIKQGRYFELRAVGFRSREEARVSLITLRKTYRDAFIKRVSSS